MTENRVTPGERRFSQEAADGLPKLMLLVERCRGAAVPVCYAVSARTLGQYDFCRALAPRAGDKVLVHPKTGAFYGTDLEAWLREKQRTDLLLTGIALDYGVSSTAREALTLGIHPILVRGACYAYDIVDSPVGPVSKQELERAHLASLSFMGVSVMSIQDILTALDPSTGRS
jgi:nicotinamidase-related amidase